MKKIILLFLLLCSGLLNAQISLSEIQDTVGKGYVPITDYDPALATYIQKYMLLQDYLQDSISWGGITALNLYQVLTNGNDAGGLDAINFAEVEADEFIGDLRGAVLFKAQAGETLAKGDVVYVSGISGNTTIVSKADADDAAKMPAFGVVAVAASSPNPVDIYTFGTLSNLNTSGFTLGDILYVSTTAGQLTATPPTGESALLQNIAKVTRVDNAAGSIKISGAGRTNATPNLNTGRLFVGNASNQAVADGTIYVDIANSRVGVGISNPLERFVVSGGNMQLRGTTYTDFSDYWGSNDNSAIFTPYGFLGSSGSFATSLYSNGYRNNTAGFTYIGTNGNTSTASGIDLLPTGDIYFRNGTASGTVLPVRMTIKNGGNTGIGTSSPSATLDVNGDVEIATVPTENTDNILTYGSTGLVSQRTVASLSFTESQISDLNHYSLADLLLEDGTGSGLDADLLDGQSGAYYLDNTDSQTLFFASPNLSISGGNSVDISAIDTDTQLTQEQVEDYAFDATRHGTGTQTLITVTYDDVSNNVDYVVNDDLSLYDNTTSGFLSAEVDGSTTNEIQDISTTGAAGNISISSGSTLNLNVDDADASSSNEYNTNVALVGNNLQVTDGGGTLSTSLAVYLDNTDSQGLDVAQLTGTNLELSLDNDGEATKVIDLSSLDDSGTDDQTLSFTAPNLSIEDGNSVDITNGVSLSDFTDDIGVGYWDRTGTTITEANSGDDLNFDSNTFFVDASTNRVGIGTNVPDEEIHIKKNSNVALKIEAENTNAAALNIVAGTTDWAFYADQDLGDELRLSSPSFLNIITFEGSGEVGIGFNNVNPTSTLDILGTSEFSDDANFDSGTLFVDASTNRVGIGVTNPTFKVDVAAGAISANSLGGRSISSAAIHNLSTSGRTSFIAEVANAYSIKGDDALYYAIFPFDSGHNGYAYRTSVGTTLTDTYWTDYDGNGYFAGNLGIGTPSPSKQLTIQSTGNAESLIETTGDYLAATTLKNAYAQWRIGVEPFDDGLVFRQQNAGYTVGEALKLETDLDVRVYNNLRVDAMTQDDAESQVVVWDSGTNNLRWRDVSTIGDGNGIFDGTNDGSTVPTAFDVGITDDLNFASGLLLLDNVAQRRVVVNDNQNLDVDFIVKTGAFSDAFFLNGNNGQITLGRYGTGAVTGTETYILGVETDGRIVDVKRALGTAGDGTNGGASSGESLVTFAAADVTTDGDITFSDANDEFTATNAGKYRISYTMQISGAGSNVCEGYVKIGNTEQAAKYPRIYSGSTPGTLYAYSSSFTVDLTAGQTIDLYVNAVTSTCTCSHAYLEVERLIGY